MFFDFYQARELYEEYFDICNKCWFAKIKYLLCMTANEWAYIAMKKKQMLMEDSTGQKSHYPPA